MQKVKVFRAGRLGILFFALTVLLAGAIFYMSGEPATASGARSGSLAEGILKLFYPQYDALSAAAQAALLASADHLLRKCTHFCVYAALGGLFLLDSLCFAAKPATHILRALLCAALYASSDEIHQAFVPGRGPAVTDVLLDSAGALCGILAVWAIVYLIRRRKAKHANR